MPNSLILERAHFVKGIDPVADFADTVQSSDVVSMRGHEKLLAVIHKGVGTTGTSTITVEACDDVVPTNTTAIPFRYRAMTSGDTAGAITLATAAGFTTTAGSSQLYLVEVDAEAVAAAGYTFVRVKMTEVVNSPVLGGMLLMLLNPTFEGAAVPSSVIV